MKPVEVGATTADTAPGRSGRPRVSLVVARSVPGNVIGRDNQLPWRLRSDLRRFRQITLDHAIIMGRKTYGSIGRPLPRRLSIVLSALAPHTPTPLQNFDDASPLLVQDRAGAIQAAEAFAVARGQDEYFIVGGFRLFRDFLDAGLVDRIHLTEVQAPDLAGDTFFPDPFPEAKWSTSSTEITPVSPDDEYPTLYRRLERI